MNRLKSKNSPVYQLCAKSSRKFCPETEGRDDLNIASPVSVDGSRKRRSTNRRQRRARERNGATDAIADNKFYISGEMYVWLMDQFEPKLTGFADWAENNYRPGSPSKIFEKQNFEKNRIFFQGEHFLTFI